MCVCWPERGRKKQGFGVDVGVCRRVCACMPDCQEMPVLVGVRAVVALSRTIRLMQKAASMGMIEVKP